MAPWAIFIQKIGGPKHNPPPSMTWYGCNIAGEVKMAARGMKNVGRSFSLCQLWYDNHGV